MASSLPSTPSPMRSFLRGALEHAPALARGTDDEAAPPLVNRVLDESTDEKPFTIMLTVLVAFILMFFIVCTYQVMRIFLCKWFCGRDVRPTVVDPNGNDDTMHVHEGRVFNLTGHQRRAVLEAIFSERSKAVTDQDVADEKRKNKKRKNQVAAGPEENKVPMDAVEIPDVSTMGTDVSSGNVNHQNLAPTDNFGDVEIATNMDDVDSSVPPLTRSTLEAADNLDDQSNRTYEHVFQDSGSISDMEDEILPDAKLQPIAVKAVDSIDRIYDLTVSEVNSPAELKDDHDDDEDYKLSFTQVINDYGEHLPIGSNPFGDGGPSSSFEGNWGDSPPISVTFDPVWLQRNEEVGGDRSIVDSSSMLISDDDDENDTDLNACRSALFRNKSDSLPASNIVVDAANVEGVGECKNEDSNDNEIPALEQVPSTDSFGNFCEYITPLNLHIPVPMTKRESFATIASEYTFDDDDTTGDNVCPICLCGYKKGDILVVSHHCTHCFHKDCILEWLDTHEECPLCRVSMVTSLELNRAATSLVGKTRMYRAVASLQSSSPGINMRYRTQQSSPSNVINGPSPLGRSVRSRSAAAGAAAAAMRTPPRGYQNPMAFS